MLCMCEVGWEWLCYVWVGEGGSGCVNNVSIIIGLGHTN